MKVEHHEYDEITGLYTESSMDHEGLWIGLRWNIAYWGKSAQQELMFRNKLSRLGFEFEMYRGASYLTH